MTNALNDWRPTDRLIPGSIRVAGDRLAYSDSMRRVRRALDDDQMLEDFLRLANAPVARVGDFARRYGVLWLCEHDLPATHNHSVGGDGRGCRPRRRDPERPGKHLLYWEPISVWRDFSRQANEIISVMAPGLNLAPAGGWLPLPPLSTLNEWLAMTGVRPVVDWINGRLRLRWGGVGVFGVLALQLALRVTKERGLALCAGCGRPFTPQRRRPRAGENHYCEDCGRVQAQRDASRRYRRRIAAKQSEARALRQSGATMHAICKQVNAPIAHVRHWVADVDLKAR